MEKAFTRFAFKLWNKTQGKMMYDDLEAFCQFNDGIMKCDEDCVLLQCTGVKDLKDRIIFEGDVCRQGGEFYEIFWDDKLGKYSAKIIAEKVKNSKYAIPKGAYVPTTIELITFGFIVVGNIYENPEYLNR